MGQRSTTWLYHAIKKRVIAYEFAQGKRIYLEPIANEYGVSTWPVRQLLDRLAAEGLVIKVPNKGFYAMTLSEDDAIGQYQVTSHLLSLAVWTLSSATGRSLPGNERIADTLQTLDGTVISDDKVLATHTAEIFAHIAALPGRPAIADAINRTSERLFYVRTLECQHLEGVQSELMCFCELLLRGEYEELAEAIKKYHERRLASLPGILARSRQ